MASIVLLQVRMEPSARDDRDPQTYQIIGAGMEVHNELGCGFLEQVYRRPLAIELRHRDVSFVIEKQFPVIYKGEPTGVYYTPDFVCYGDVIVELKAIRSIGPIEEAQTINYMKLSKCSRALILNFGATTLEWRRFVLSDLYRRPSPRRGRYATVEATEKGA